MRFISSIITRHERRALCALLLLLTFVCPRALASSPLTEVGVHIGIISVATSRVNPLTPVEREFMSLTDLMYEGLMYLDDDYQPQPCLAERYTCSTNGKTWTFYLRDGVTFHDGTPLTAYDVVATAEEILRLVQEEKTGRYASLQYFVKSIKTLDNRSLEIVTNRANYGFLYAMTFPVLKAGEVRADNPVGTGPYYLDMFTPAVNMLLAANMNWWQNPPDYRQILVNFFATSRDLISAYEYSNVDAVLTRAITAAQYRGGVSSFNVDFRTTQLETLMMNNQVRELEDLRVREAIRYMINMDDLVNNVYYGMATRTDTPLIPGTWTYWDDGNRHEYNKQKAIALLDESGWIDGDDEDTVREKIIDGKKANLHLRFYVYEEQDNSVRVEVANRIADSLMEVGIECNVETLSYNTVSERLKAANFDLCLAAFNIDFTPDPGYLLISGNTCNFMRYKSAEMDKLFDTLRATQEYGQYRQTLGQIQELFWKDCPFVCLYYRNGALLTREMFTSARDVREPEVLRGIESFPLD